MDEWVEQQRTYAEYCDTVETEATRLVAATDGIDPAAPVPSCPGWTMAELLTHLGVSLRRAEHVVRNRSQQPVWAKDVEAGLPDDTPDYPAWLAEVASTLVTTLWAAEADTPVWTDGVDRRVRYWARRILFEVVVHRADVELARGREPVVDPVVAADGIEEFLTNLPYFSRVDDRIRELGVDGRTVHLHATDSDGEWVVRLGADGFAWERGHEKSTVAVRGSTSDLLLLTYGRLPATAERFSVFGDDELLTRWLRSSAV